MRAFYSSRLRKDEGGHEPKVESHEMAEIESRSSLIAMYKMPLRPSGLRSMVCSAMRAILLSSHSVFLPECVVEKPDEQETFHNLEPEG